jgi:hypothetical protein
MMGHPVLVGVRPLVRAPRGFEPSSAGQRACFGVSADQLDKLLFAAFMAVADSAERLHRSAETESNWRNIHRVNTPLSTFSTRTSAVRTSTLAGCGVGLGMINFLSC